MGHAAYSDTIKSGWDCALFCLLWSVFLETKVVVETLVWSNCKQTKSEQSLKCILLLIHESTISLYLDMFDHDRKNQEEY